MLVSIDEPRHETRNGERMRSRALARQLTGLHLAAVFFRHRQVESRAAVRHRRMSRSSRFISQHHTVISENGKH